MNFCPKCGARVKPNAKFCTKCGNKLIRSSNSAVQPTQVKTNVQPTVQMNKNTSNAAGRSFSYTKNLSQKQIMAIIAAVVIILIGVFGWRSYHSKPSHNSSNPMSNESYVVQKEDGVDELEFSAQNYGDVWRNIYILGYKKLGASKAVIDDMKALDPQDWYSFYHNGDNSDVEEVLDEDKDCRKELASDIEDVFPDGDSVIYLSPEKVKEGDKAEVKLRLAKWFLKKYDIDGRPIKIKISNIQTATEFNE